MSDDAVWIDLHIATLSEQIPDSYGAIKDAVMVVRDGRVAWLGARGNLPQGMSDGLGEQSAGNRWVTPGLVDCHTHLVYGGNRAEEFEMRLTGLSYAEIANRGGGIVSTVKATREADEEGLLKSAEKRLTALMREGVTTVEIKSGYGLDIDTEVKMLRVARQLADLEGIDVKTTFLGAHALPPEYAGRADEYIEFVCAQSLPAVARQGLADAVDAFCETIGFNAEQTERVLQCAVTHGLPVKLHAEQLSDMKGAVLAARYGALSADHLEYVAADGVRAMSDAGTVAVLLPGAFYYLKETTKPPIEQLREHGVDIALATDSNPGSSPAGSLLLMLNMGCTLFQMTPEETLAAVTRVAAKALGIEAEVGTLEVGKQADFVLWDIEHPAELAYRFGANPCYQVVKQGRTVYTAH